MTSTTLSPRFAVLLWLLLTSFNRAFAWEASAPPESPTGLDDIEQLSTFTDTAMATLMNGYHLPAGAVAIVKEDRILQARGYGYADLERRIPVTTDTLFRIGSISKLFTWTAVMQLRERGALDLDRDVNAYLHGWKLPNTFRQSITLRHLMTHTAGFEESFLGFLDHSIRGQPRDVTAGDIVPLDEYVRSHIPARVRRPGEMTAYSNYGAALAGLIVQNASGTPYAQFVRANIFEPLGMHGATFREPLPSSAPAAIGYVRRLGIYEPRPFEFISSMAPAGAASASALDMARFMMANLQAGRLGDVHILSARSIEELHAPAFKLDSRLPGMALGYYEQTYNGLRAVGHSGDTSDFHSELLLLPKQRVGLFFSFVGEGGGAARADFRRAFFDRYYPAPALVERPSPRSRSAALDGYAGNYLLTRRNWSSIEKLLSVVGTGIQVAPASDGRIVVTGLDDEPRQFAPVDADLFAQVQGTQRLGFRRDRDGNVTHLIVDNLPFMPAERVSGWKSPATWHRLLAVVFVLFLGVLLALRYRWREIRRSPAGHRCATYVEAATAGAAWLIVAAFAGIAVYYKERMLMHVPLALKAALLLPMLFVVLTALSLGAAFRVWRLRYWSLGRRLHYSLVTAAAIALCFFFLQWRVLGWQLP